MKFAILQVILVNLKLMIQNIKIKMKGNKNEKENNYINHVFYTSIWNKYSKCK